MSIKESSESIEYLLLRKDTKELYNLTKEIKDLLHSTFSFQDHLCLNTCIHCPEPCCSVANIWFDLKDLLFIHLAKEKFPPMQPRENHNTCIFFNPGKGCSLNRFQRPFICNCYLCGTQIKYLNKNDHTGLQKMRSVLISIKNIRNVLEDTFIKLTS